ncbi:MAG: hypothetical protein Tsb002_11450 [Wenzhouxiangellaceae bacterium]
MMNRRQFSITLAGLTVAGSASASGVDTVFSQLPMLDGNHSVPRKALFEVIRGQQFNAKGVAPCHLTLSSVDAASKRSDEQFYLRFNASHQSLPEGIYHLSHNHQRLDLYLTPVNDQPGMMEAVVNTQTA